MDLSFLGKVLGMDVGSEASAAPEDSEEMAEVQVKMRQGIVGLSCLG